MTFKVLLLQRGIDFTAVHYNSRNVQGNFLKGGGGGVSGPLKKSNKSPDRRVFKGLSIQLSASLEPERLFVCIET
jgi:hypothetical protein